MRILLIVREITGLQYHRQLCPHAVMWRNNDSVKVEQTKNFFNISPEELKQFDIVHFLREINLSDPIKDTAAFSPKQIIDICHRAGCKVIFDIDDYWHLPNNHALYKINQYLNVPSQTIECLKYSDLVTTTTNKLAQEIKTHNNNVEVIPNCIDTGEEQWHPHDTKGAVKFGWLGGLHHEFDLEILRTPVRKLIGKATFSLCGWSNNPFYHLAEEILSANERGFYERNEGSNVWNYGRMYNNFNVALAPLAHNKFNQFKSELKLIEAGTMKKSVICSDIYPYNTFPKNSILKANDISDWVKHIKSLSDSENMRNEYSLSLHEYIAEKYNMEKCKI
jgi:glycosyltransferase involved in cell wall biosynthesis